MTNDVLLNNRYRLVAQQGSGGMAVIYRAVDQALGRTVAVKILRPTLTNDPAFLARFRNEARSVANLAHPNIVTVHDVGSDGATHYIVMEFIEGQDLKRIIKAEGALPTDRMLNLAIQICAGIGFAHRAGLVHADVKPQNILVTRDDLVKVTDFGIAQALSVGQPGERQSVVWGSPHYFAPEQARGEKPSPASDVYSIGIVMFEMLTGRLPYQGNNQQELALAHIRERIPLVSEFNPTAPDYLVRIVAKLMSKEPEQRYRMADQLGSILSGYRDRGRADAMASASAPPPPPIVTPNIPVQQAPIAAPQPTVQGRPASPPVMPTLPNNNAVPQQPLPGQDYAATQRYGLAPNSPGAPSYNAGYNAAPGAQPYPNQQPPPPPGSSGQYYTGGYSRPQPPQDVPFALDTVTILLAIIAFFAVACLIPLYIAVFQARFGA